MTEIHTTRRLAFWTGFLCALQVTFFIWASPAAATHDLPTPVAWWKLDETVGATTFVDSSPNANDAVCFGPTTCPTAGLGGHFGTAALYDGSDDCLVAPSIAAYTSDEFTLSAWDNGETDGVSDNTILQRRNGATENGFRLRVSKTTGDISAQFFPAGSASAPTELTATGAFTFGVYHHVAATFVAAPLSIKIYLDGVEQSTTSSTAVTATSTNNNIGIGCRADSGTLVRKGSLDDVRIYNQALTPTQVEDLFLDPQHHACIPRTATTFNPTTQFLNAAGPILIKIAGVLFIIGFIVAVPFMRRGGGVFAILGTLTFLGVSVPTVQATHFCTETMTGNALADTIAVWLIPVLFIFAVAALFWWIIQAVRNRTGGSQY